MIFSPLKTIIEGTPAELWPKSFAKKNKHNMPVNAMIVQVCDCNCNYRFCCLWW
ncbi:hypothetical protein QY895_05700 [Latilactobacillus sakei]